MRLFAIPAMIGLAASPAMASTYLAKPAASAESRIIAPDIVWSCGPAACQGATQESRPTVLCQGLVKRAGRVESFVVDGRAFTAAELERCNSAAKAPRHVLAAQ
jgi:hypothetical protein